MSRTRTFRITDRITGEVIHNVSSDELLATLHNELVWYIKHGLWREGIKAYSNISIYLEDNE